MRIFSTPDNPRQTASSGIIMALVLLLPVFNALVLHAMSRPWVCPCGIIALWPPAPLSPQVSQQVLDWYTPSHILHGLLFYGALTSLRQPIVWLRPWSHRLLAALILESAWEILENSPFVIAQYRATAAGATYNGDSILNSTSDLAMMTLGFLLANRLPWPLTVLCGLLLEASAAFMIRDGMLLNIMNFIHPIPTLAAWQAAIQP